MIEDIKEVDRLLSAITVSGDNVILIAQARMKLKDMYDKATVDHEYKVKEK